MVSAPDIPTAQQPAPPEIQVSAPETTGPASTFLAPASSRSTQKSRRRAEGRILLTDKPLNRMELRFSQLVAQGWPLWRCYQDATGAKNKKTCEQQAWRWRMRPAVEAEIIRQRAQLTEATAATRAEKRNVLAGLMRSHETPAAVRVEAIKADNRMTGDDAPSESRVTHRMVFTVDPIGEGTRGQGREEKVVGELSSGSGQDDSDSQTPALPAPDA